MPHAVHVSDKYCDWGSPLWIPLQIYKISIKSVYPIYSMGYPIYPMLIYCVPEHSQPLIALWWDDTLEGGNAGWTCSRSGILKLYRQSMMSSNSTTITSSNMTRGCHWRGRCRNSSSNDLPIDEEKDSRGWVTHLVIREVNTCKLYSWHPLDSFGFEDDFWVLR